MEPVYKYCNTDGLDILESLQLKITPPNQFNDPFEFTPSVSCSNPARRIKQLFKDKSELKGWYDEQRASGYTGNFRQFRNELRAKTPQIIEQLAPRMPEVNREAQREYVDHISTTYGLLCLSRRRDSLLMWGHYCDSYRGIVVGFDNSYEGFNGVHGLRDVQYVRGRVLFDPSWRHGGAASRAFTNQLIFSKNHEWAYEHEVRQLFVLQSLQRRKIANGSVGHFFPMRAEVIVSVTLGPRCNPSTEDAVRNALRAPHFSHVHLDRAELHETEFKLNFVPI